MKLTNADRITFLDARIKRATSQKRVEKQYSFRETKVQGVILEDLVKALTENNETDAEMDRRYQI